MSQQIFPITENIESNDSCHIQKKPGWGERIGYFVDHFNPGRFLLWKIELFVVIYTAFVCCIDNHEIEATKFVEANAAISISAVVGLLLIFRNNSANERWWEARKLWGQLVNESRNLAIKTRAYADGLSEDERYQFAQLIAGFATALKLHLRADRDSMALSALAIADANQHVPSAIALKIYRTLKVWRKDGVIDQWEQLQLDLHAKTFMDICGATERILNSPIAGSYKLLLWFGLLVNVTCLPWFLVPSFHWLSIPIMAVTSYFIFGLELLAEEVERPFDDLPNDLPLDAICQTIRRSVGENLEVDMSAKPQTIEVS